MSKVTLDMETFKALASDTRLDILKALDGKKLSLKDISSVTKLNKATLHEHLVKLNEAGLVKKNEREGHKWVFYKLSWKGECLLHPENTRIVVLFGTTFFALAVGIIQLMSYIKGSLISASGSTYSRSADLLPQWYYSLKSSNEMGSGIQPPSVLHIKNVPSDILDGLSTDYINTYYLEFKNFGGQSTTFPDFPFLKNFVSSGGEEELALFTDAAREASTSFYQDPVFLFIALACFTIFSVVLCFSLWRYQENKKSKI